MLKNRENFQALTAHFNNKECIISMTDKEIKVQLALGTFEIKYLTIEVIKNITDIDLIQQLCNEVPGCWATKSNFGILCDAIYDQYNLLVYNYPNTPDRSSP